MSDNDYRVQRAPQIERAKKGTNVWRWDGKKAIKHSSHDDWEGARVEMARINVGGMKTAEGHSLAIRGAEENASTAAKMFRGFEQHNRTAADRNGEGPTTRRTDEFMHFDPNPSPDVVEAHEHFGAEAEWDYASYFGGDRTVVNPRELHTAQEHISGEAIEKVAKIPSSVTPEEDLPRVYRDEQNTPWLLDGNHRAARAITKRRRLHVAEFSHYALQEAQQLQAEAEERD